MSTTRQAMWQAKNPDRQRSIRATVKMNAREKLRRLGYGMTHEEICDRITNYEKTNGSVDDKHWWLIYEYLDFNYNNLKICGSLA